MKREISRLTFSAACDVALTSQVVKNMQRGGIGLVIIGDRAAMTCFLENQKGPHVRVIRECMKELRDTGVFPFYKKKD